MFAPRPRPSDPTPVPTTPTLSISDNRRRFGRIHTLGVQCTLGEVVDISASGMRVIARGRALLDRGESATISLATPAGLLAIDVQLVWVRRSGWRNVEMGVHFINPTPDVLEGVRSILRGGNVGPVEAEQQMRRKVA